MIRHLFVAATLAFGLAPAARAAEADAQLWVAGSASVQLDPRTRIYGSYGQRFSTIRDGLYSDSGRVVAIYKLSDRVSLGAGFVHLQILDHGRRTSTLERPFEQLDIDLGGGFSSRTQIEQSFVTGPSEMGWRLRERIGWSRLLDADTRISLGGEAFVTVISPRGGTEGFTRLRGTATLSQPISSSLVLSVGYIHQWTRRPADDEIIHAANLRLSAFF
ncbi:DUF2490 domain-containing protein [Parasphingopyxis marina]|uniref:DUF2490 domain-containing protein n=1 Tax=Parasphingopyxis marina TaxID=2761622 RepID=A0A842HYE7_9SPHN|nr:DUF2490 domain-containing protein [Parasphingopyxis marina]MBC2777371.1 DUF2490 domain-containing protein [Parasphingopyxis marina]